MPALEVLPMKAINMHVFLYYLDSKKHFSKGMFSYKMYTTETAYLAFVSLENDLPVANY